MQKKKTDGWLATYFIGPALVIMLGVILYPVVYNLILSFFDFGIGQTGLTAMRFIGIANFQELLSSRLFWVALKNTLIWTAGNTIIIEVLALIAAIYLNKEIRGQSIYRVALLLPWVIPGVVTGIAWIYMFDVQFGPINDLLKQLGWIREYVSWLGGLGTALVAIMIAYIWKVYPMAMTMLLADLQSIPQELYEAAKVDGVNSWQAFWYVTLPMLKGAIFTTSIFMALTAFNSFDLIYIMTGGGPLDSTTTLGLRVYNLGFRQFEFGSASALATIMFVGTVFVVGLMLYRRLRATNTVS